MKYRNSFNSKKWFFIIHIARSFFSMGKPWLFRSKSEFTWSSSYINNLNCIFPYSHEYAIPFSDVVLPEFRTGVEL